MASIFIYSRSDCSTGPTQLCCDCKYLNYYWIPSCWLLSICELNISVESLTGRTMTVFVPAALLEQSQFHGSPLQHGDGHYCDWHVGSSGENTRYSSLLPVWVNLTDIHWVKVPARVKHTPTDVCLYISLFHERINVFLPKRWDDTAPWTMNALYVLTPELPDEIPEVHPEQAILGSLGTELPLQVWRPVWPAIRPGSCPGEAAPRVPQLQ